MELLRTMAKFNSPHSFAFDKSEELEWRQRFLRYRTATKLNKDDGRVQVRCLIYAMGQEAENIFRFFVFNQVAHEDDFDRVLAKFPEEMLHMNACASTNVHNGWVRKRRCL